jgi:hypothetical protein
MFSNRSSATGELIESWVSYFGLPLALLRAVNLEFMQLFTARRPDSELSYKMPPKSDAPEELRIRRTGNAI